MPYKDLEKRREHQNEYRKSNNAKGLCVSCKKKAVLGKTMCAKHLLSSALRSKKYYESHKEKVRKRIYARKIAKMGENQ